MMTSYSHILTTPQKKILLSLHKANPEKSVKSVVGIQATMGSAWSSMKEHLNDDQLLPYLNQNKDNMHFSFFIEQILFKILL